MTDRVDANDRTVSDVIDKAIDGWEPAESGQFNPEAYTWAFLPCPNCNETHLTGVHDPNESIEIGEGTFVVIPSGGEAGGV